MSNDAAKFIKKHKAWLERSKEYLAESDWHVRKVSTEVTEENKKPFAAAKKLTTVKEAMLNNDKSIATNITSRLKYFIKKTSGDKHLEGNKKTIKYLLEIIEIFLINCDDYLENNNLQKIDNQAIRNLEIQFQDLIFNTKIKIEDALDEMGAYEEHEALEIQFFKKDKASLIMREPLVLSNPDVRLRMEAIPMDFNVGDSNEMLINMKEKDIPPYNHRKHFFDQDLSTIQFWNEEYLKMQNGINLNGYFLHPWLYHHLNIFKTKIPVSKDKEEIMCPPLRDNEWFFVENLKTAEDAGNRGLMLYGTRRFSKSTIMASYIEWKAKTKFNSVATLTGGNESDLLTLLDKVDTSMAYAPEALRLILQKTDGERTNGIMHLGLKPAASELLDFSQIMVQNLAGGRKTASQKTAGGAPSAFVVDEIGKFAFLKAYLAALPSFATPFGYKCVPILSGTGGEADLSMDAIKVISNPEAYNMIPMNWDLLESKIDPEFITWKRRIFATFMPGQMGYEVGFKSINKPMGEFLGMKGPTPDLDKVRINAADWENNRNVLDEMIAEAKKEKGSKGVVLEQQKKVQNPQDPEDCFITIEGNPFPSEEAKLHKNRIIETGDTGRKVFLSKDANGVIIDTPAEDFPLAEWPHPGGFVDAPVQLFESLPISPPPFGLYVAGMDDYKHDQSDGDSVGTLYIYKRQWFDPLSLTLVATYASRPNPRSKFDRQCHYLLKVFNATCFHENEDNNFKTYLDNKHESDLYLAKGFDFAAELNLNNNGNRQYGWSATPKNIAFGYGLIKKYLEQEFKVVREDGTEFTILGVQRIKDIGLLEEIQNFTADGNFDRLRGFMGALMYSHYLDTTHQFPRPDPIKKPDAAKKKKDHSRVSPFRKQSNKYYRG